MGEIEIMFEVGIDFRVNLSVFLLLISMGLIQATGTYLLFKFITSLPIKLLEYSIFYSFSMKEDFYYLDLQKPVHI